MELFNLYKTVKHGSRIGNSGKERMIDEPIF